MAPHSSTLAWKMPWTEEPGGLQSMGLLRVRHDWATSLSLFTFLHWRRKWQPTPVFLPGESQGWGSLVAAIYGVTQSRTRLKWLSSSSSSSRQFKKPTYHFLQPFWVGWQINYSFSYHSKHQLTDSTSIFSTSTLLQSLPFDPITHDPQWIISQLSPPSIFSWMSLSL